MQISETSPFSRSRPILISATHYLQPTNIFAVRIKLEILKILIETNHA